MLQNSTDASLCPRPERLTLHMPDSVWMRIVSGEEGVMAQRPEAKTASSGGPARARALKHGLLMLLRLRTLLQICIHLLI